MILVAAASAPQLAPTQSAWEGPRTFDAREVLTAADRSGPHHSVGDRVPTESFFYAFALRTEFGDLEGTMWGTTQLGFDAEANTITIQSLSSQPFQLINVRKRQ